MCGECREGRGVWGRVGWDVGREGGVGEWEKGEGVVDL